MNIARQVNLKKVLSVSDFLCEAELSESEDQAELSPLINLNCRSIRSMILLAKVFVHSRKNGQGST